MKLIKLSTLFLSKHFNYYCIVKKTILFSLIFLAGFTAYSQNAKDAEKLLDRISQRYKKFKTIKADFLYSIESKVEKINEKQRGTIVVKGNKFRLDVANQVIICDNKTIFAPSPATFPALRILIKGSLGTSPIFTAEAEERYEPKEPASNTCCMSVSLISNCSSKIFQPVAIDALAN